MKFTIHNRQKAVSIDDDFWKRAFNYAANELQIGCLHAEVHCVFIEMDMERKTRFKKGTAILGATNVIEGGAMLYVVASDQMDPKVQYIRRGLGLHDRLKSSGQMVTTFFHEMTHVKQLLVEELIVKPRCVMWKGEKWDKREYSFAPWEVEAQTFSDKAYDKFLQREVNRVMQDEEVSCVSSGCDEVVFYIPAGRRVPGDAKCIQGT
jgi:hypothetical protein